MVLRFPGSPEAVAQDRAFIRDRHAGDEAWRGGVQAILRDLTNAPERALAALTASMSHQAVCVARLTPRWTCPAPNVPPP